MNIRVNLMKICMGACLSIWKNYISIPFSWVELIKCYEYKGKFDENLYGSLFINMTKLQGLNLVFSNFSVFGSFGYLHLLCCVWKVACLAWLAKILYLRFTGSTGCNRIENLDRILIGWVNLPKLVIKNIDYLLSFFL